MQVCILGMNSTVFLPYLPLPFGMLGCFFALDLKSGYF